MCALISVHVQRTPCAGIKCFLFSEASASDVKESVHNQIWPDVFMVSQRYANTVVFVIKHITTTQGNNGNYSKKLIHFLIRCLTKRSNILKPTSYEQKMVPRQTNKILSLHRKQKCKLWREIRCHNQQIGTYR